jgi:hypothetical protein
LSAGGASRPPFLAGWLAWKRRASQWPIDDAIAFIEQAIKGHSDA